LPPLPPLSPPPSIPTFPRKRSYRLSPDNKEIAENKDLKLEILDG
jgi:hypothetical protein